MGSVCKLAGFVKSPAKPGLPAFLMHRLHVASGHVGHQQFDRVGADINDCATVWLHAASRLRAAAGDAQVKKA